jgi:rhodanese-related sulfurtransferase
MSSSTSVRRRFFHEMQSTQIETLRGDKRNAPLLLDVREPEEWAEFRIPGNDVLHMPLSSILEMSPDAALAEVKRVLSNEQQPVVVYCRGGVRSARVCTILEAANCENELINMSDGISGWNNSSSS